MNKPLVFALQDHPLHAILVEKLLAEKGLLHIRQFPDGESFLRIDSDVKNRPCIVLVDLVKPNDIYLPLIFLTDTLRELGAASVGLVAPYLSYMRQDIRFNAGEAVTSRIFAQQLSQHIDWLVTVDPHLHRYHSLDEIYSIPSRVLQAASLLAEWLKDKTNIVLVGPDAESRQWVEKIATLSHHPFVVGEKLRRGDRDVVVTLENIRNYAGCSAVIVDDVISSGHTLLECIDALQRQGIKHISCAAIHGIFAEGSDTLLMQRGLTELVTCNSIAHSSNGIDLSVLLVPAINECLSHE